MCLLDIVDKPQGYNITTIDKEFFRFWFIADLMPSLRVVKCEKWFEIQTKWVWFGCRRTPIGIHGYFVIGACPEGEEIQEFKRLNIERMTGPKTSDAEAVDFRAASDASASTAAQM